MNVAIKNYQSVMDTIPTIILENVMLARNRKNLPGFDAPVITARGGKRGVTYRSENAHVQYWTGPDIPIEINDQRLSIAYHAWTKVAGDGTPRLKDFLTSATAPVIEDPMLFLGGQRRLSGGVARRGPPAKGRP
jgi:hypothetical protein